MGFPSKNTGVGCHFLLQGFFPSQGLNQGLPRLPALVGGFFTALTTPNSCKCWSAHPSNGRGTTCHINCPKDEEETTYTKGSQAQLDCPCDFRDGDKFPIASRRPFHRLWDQELCPQQAGRLTLWFCLPQPHKEQARKARERQRAGGAWEVPAEPQPPVLSA